MPPSSNTVETQIELEPDIGGVSSGLAAEASLPRRRSERLIAFVGVSANSGRCHATGRIERSVDSLHFATLGATQVAKMLTE